MKKLLKSFFALATLAVLTFQISGCKKDCPAPPTVTYPIQGLWEGTYTVGAGNPVPAGTSFYLSLSIYPGGKASYKSKGYYNGSSDYITFADGTWTLNGTAFAFNVTTINYAGGGAQQAQSGTATYNSIDGTLTNGVIGNATWTMKRVN
jgi:hypothetical protein